MRFAVAVPSAGIMVRSVETVLLCTTLLTGAAMAQVAPQRPPVTVRPAGADTGNARTDTLLFLHALYDAVDRANPRVRAASELSRAAAARVSGATKPPDPELQLGFMNYSLPRLAPDATLGMRQLQLMQMVPLPGKLAAAGDAARARAQAAGSRAADTRWDVRAATAMAFYERWSAGERIEIARATRRLLEDAAAVATAMYRVGEGRQSDVLRARVEIARMDEEIIRMQVMAESARARLAAGKSVV